MKKTITFLSLLLALILHTACGKSNDSKDNNDPGKPSGGTKPYIRMKVNGVEWYDDKSALAGLSEADGTYNVTIAGRDDDFGSAPSSLSVIFSRTTDIIEGNYLFTSSSDGASVTKVDNKTYIMTGTTSGASFTVTITGISGSGSIRKVKGTFSGTLPGPTSSDKITITEGEFSGY